MPLLSFTTVYLRVQSFRRFLQMAANTVSTQTITSIVYLYYCLPVVKAHLQRHSSSLPAHNNTADSSCSGRGASQMAAPEKEEWRNSLESDSCLFNYVIHDPASVHSSLPVSFHSDICLALYCGITIITDWGESRFSLMPERSPELNWPEGSLGSKTLESPFI